jgi:hypothetical protein
MGWTLPLHRVHAERQILPVNSGTQIYNMHVSLSGSQSLQGNIEDLESNKLTLEKGISTLSFGIVAGIAATMATGLAAPDRHKWSRVTIGTTPSENIAIGSLDNGEDVTGALVGHCLISRPKKCS